mgnify:FL=1
MILQARIAFIQAQTAAMLAELEGMKVMNAERERQGMAFAYDEEAFLSLPLKYGLYHKALQRALETED